MKPVLDGLRQNGAFQEMQRIEYARRQALDAYQKASECIDNRMRDEWLKAAALWEALARQYEQLLQVGESSAG